MFVLLQAEGAADRKSAQDCREAAACTAEEVCAADGPAGDFYHAQRMNITVE